MSKVRTYTVRGLDAAAGIFSCTGELAALPAAVEVTDVPTEARAVELMLTHPAISTMTAKILPVGQAAMIDSLSIKADALISDTAEAKALRKALVPIIKAWAEKSRVRGLRGWRAHALRAPKVAKRKTGGYEVDFKVLLGHAVFYSQKQLSAGHVDDMTYIADTLADLRKQVDRQLPGKLGVIHVEHEATGQTTVLFRDNLCGRK